MIDKPAQYVLNQFCYSIKKRINQQNKNWLAIICGQTGSGKSFSALELARRIDHTFEVKDRIVFDVDAFMMLLNSGKLQKGNAIVWDEAGVGIPTREWWSISNKAVNYVLQTFRHDNLAVIFTTPSFDFIDSQTRKLFHTYFQTIHISRKMNIALVKPLMIDYNPSTGKIYWHKPKGSYDGKNFDIKELSIPKPSDKDVEEYEAIKRDFSSRLRETVIKEIKKVKDAQEEKPLAINRMVKDTIACGMVVMKNGKPYVNLYDVMAKFGCGSGVGTMVKRVAEKTIANQTAQETHTQAVSV